MSKPKILILTIPAGGGHDAIARVMGEALERKLADQYDIEVTNVLKDISNLVPLDRLAEEGYATSVKLLRAYPYKLFINFLNTTPKLMNKFFSTMLKPGMTALLEKKRPVLVVSTFPVLSYAASRIIKELGWDVPLVSIITDAGEVHRLWLMGVEDALLVATPDTKAYAMEQGVPADRIYSLGFPIDRSFRHLPGQSEARAQLGLEQRPTVLLTCGGLGLSPTKFVRLAQTLSGMDIDAQLLFVCGKNAELKVRLEEIQFHSSVSILGFVDNMPTLMAASDFIVGKAGWITIYEAMAAKLPTIVMDIIPGQEEPNAEYIHRHRIGLVITDPNQVALQIKDWVEHPNHLTKFREALKGLDTKTDASETIAEFIAHKFLKKQ